MDPAGHKLGGTHHGYFMPSEGDSDEAFALFSFPSLAEYEVYRTASQTDPDCQAAFELARTTQCIRRYERRFLSPVFSLEPALPTDSGLSVGNAGSR